MSTADEVTKLALEIVALGIELEPAIVALIHPEPTDAPGAPLYAKLQEILGTDNPARDELAKIDRPVPTATQIEAARAAISIARRALIADPETTPTPTG